MGKIKKFCPYYASKHISKYADLILMPYTYLLTKKFIKNSSIDLNNAIIIFDEAHNVENQAEEGNILYIIGYSI